MPWSKRSTTDVVPGRRRWCIIAIGVCNALAESMIGLVKAGEIHRREPWKGLEDAEFATLEWVAWYKDRRLLEPLGYVPPVECAQAAEERQVLLEHGTERPFCGGLLDTKQEGVYACRLCSLPLFRSGAKFESGTGWPSFFEPFDPEHRPRGRRTW